MAEGDYTVSDAQERQQPHSVRIPVVAEQATIARHTVPRERVAVHVGSESRTETLSETLVEEALRIERVPVDRVVDAPPPIRKLDDRLIVPVLEERLVVEKRLVLVEELHVLRERQERPVEMPVELRRTRVSVERDDLTGRAGDARSQQEGDV